VTKEDAPPDLVLEAVRQHASAQMRAAQARFRPVDPSLEKPRDVTTWFVQSVAMSLSESLGPTKLVASRREVQVKRGDQTFCYRFQPSMNNTAGATIVLWPHAAVHSHTLRLWRRGKPWARTYGRSYSTVRTDDGCFVGAMLGNFFSPRRYISLEIVDPADRPALLKQVTEDCCTIDARLRRDLDGPETFFAYATRADTDIECAGDDACEYIAATLGIEAVRQYARAATMAIPDGDSVFRQHFAEVCANADTRASVGVRIDGIVRFFLAHKLSLD
jgi:hypothetical protein